LKKPKHKFGDDDYDRLQNYIVAFTEFFEQHAAVAALFPDGWLIGLIAGGIDIKDTTRRSRSTRPSRRSRSSARPGTTSSRRRVTRTPSSSTPTTRLRRCWWWTTATTGPSFGSSHLWPV